MYGILVYEFWERDTNHILKAQSREFFLLNRHNISARRQPRFSGYVILFTPIYLVFEWLSSDCLILHLFFFFAQTYWVCNRVHFSASFVFFFKCCVHQAFFSHVRSKITTVYSLLFVKVIPGLVKKTLH